MDASNSRACTHCGDERLDEGFIEDSGQGTSGFARWIAGPLERGPFGGAKRMGRTRRQILAFRCAQCGHLELFAGDEITVFP
jgi:predicted nucleic-acid-binding Zn-ribbon protein